MSMHFDTPAASALTRRRKAAMIVQMMISDGGNLSLSQLPESLQEVLTNELGAIKLVDRDTVADVAAEFTAQLDAIGLSAPGSRDGAIAALSDHLSPSLAERLRAQMESVRNGDHWPTVAELSIERLVDIMTRESIEICAIALSKLQVGKAAEVLTQTPGERARRITYAMSLTSEISPDAVRRIGASLAQDYGQPAKPAFEKPPVQRLGAILNSTITDTREDVLTSLGETDPDFASDVRKAIFTFKDIAPRVKPTDIPSCIRSVDAEVLTRAIAAGLAGDAPIVASAEFILGSVSQRMAGQMREDAEEMGRIKKADAEAAMSAITTAIREMAESGVITLIDPDEDDDEDE
ncbi:FliG C-terminal domain-containing protein [Yoonia sp. I 8.24]|uniref:FliG C-terminal domain-containing protein n=1 Tax=Yoonia sp. I 8.24 TaxID=1537229 RepID=UPI001EDD07B5|nr:FliG C-terminal domain-containing protein [Yoonia sp. I 8.24]MCG3266438.1 flagellar motor switch protein FliG [Yoonia sp. I 8.24]